ncbi:AMP-binding protein [Pseudonocardia spinosispora]|uniref:AMP-binding protein n=1 Tax=Pseudonocardia spinosispora TaxID=103441 RepID=UPI000401B47F|nr:AMP-binding protein [Pseudonocardia spinosispora]
MTCVRPGPIGPHSIDSYLPADRREPLVEATIGDLLRRHARSVPDRVALIEAAPDPMTRRSWTYAQLFDSATRVASDLLDRFEPGDRVAVWAANHAEWILLQQGCALAGIVLVTINPAFLETEAGYVLRQSRARGLFHDSSYRGHSIADTVTELSPRLPDLQHTVCFDDWAGFHTTASTTCALPVVKPGDPLQIQYTSGTTGAAKGAVLHHRGVLNAARFTAVGCRFQAGETWANAMPMFHIGGVLTATATFALAGCYVLAPGFDAAHMIELVETHHATITLLVPTMLTALLDHPDHETRDLSSLRTVLSGASQVPAELVRRTRAALGCAVTIVFGQTELHGILTQTSTEDTPEDQSGTIGRPLPHVEVKIVDPATGETLPRGEPGELCARGYQTMIGYFDLPHDSAATLESDGWLRTGDLAAIDERGYLTITGRLRDMIIRGGVNIYPREIEDVLIAHPGVAEAAVVAVPDDYWGERIAAIVRPVDPSVPVEPDELREHCRAHLARFKSPTDWYFTDALPTTATGKVQKFRLRKAIADGSLRCGHVGDVAAATCSQRS